MTQQPRLDSDSRREEILEAAMRVFAEKGFHRATTRELAEAAGISEALLYRHFPSKEELYREVGQQHTRIELQDPRFQELLAQAPSTERLVGVIRVFLENVVLAPKRHIARMVAFSLLEDGEFARGLLEGARQIIEQTLSEDLDCALRDGALRFPSEAGLEALWFTQHIAFTMKLMQIPQPAVVVSSHSTEERVCLALRFTLRGMGMDEDIIDRFTDPIRSDCPPSLQQKD